MSLSKQHGWGRVLAFLFPTDLDAWLTVLRIGLGLEITLYALTLSKDWYYLFSRSGEGVITRGLAEALLDVESSFVPRLGWLVEVASTIGLNERATLLLVWIVLLAAGILLLLGIFSRAAAIVTWFLHLCAAKSGGLVTYGVDNFITIGLFYLMLSPLPDRRALEWKFWKRRPADPRSLGFFRRVLQLHLCLVYFFSGLAKALGSGWWNGSNIWRALTRPPFDLLPPDLIASWHLLFPLAGICVCVIELGYPFLIWPHRTRRIWLTLACLLHLSTGLAMGMHLFALSMIVLNLAAFAPSTALSLHLPEEETPETKSA